MEAKIRHLEMIQGAVNRASDNSLRIKGFAMLLLAGTLALTLRDDVSVIPFHIGIILLIIVSFLGLLDFYFLRQSDLYRILYNETRVQSEENIDFSMMEVEQYGSELDIFYRNNTPFPIMATAILYGSIAIIVLFGTFPSLLSG